MSTILAKASKQLPAIFHDIVGRLDAAGLAYAVVGRIALALHEEARFVRDAYTRSACRFALAQTDRNAADAQFEGFVTARHR